MTKKKFLSFFCSLIILMLGFSSALGGWYTAAETDVAAFAGTDDLVRISDVARPTSAKPRNTLGADELAKIRLCAGGMPFGVKMTTDGILVVGICDVAANGESVSPAREAGLREGDVIQKIDGERAYDADMLSNAVRDSEGRGIALSVRRGTDAFERTIVPVYSESDGAYKVGLWVKSRAAGIGTVTFIDPETGKFGGLGHGICDGDTGVLLPLGEGEVYDVRIDGVMRGQSGLPGELHGYFCSGKCGALLANTDFGIFGVKNNVPQTMSPTIELCPRDEIREGEAVIYSTVDGTEPREYTVNIRDVDMSNSDIKNFVIEVTDPVLLEATGGIVQGMSGSPVIQDGRLVGALTHVLVNDPTRGYGIFIENMLGE